MRNKRWRGLLPAAALLLLLSGCLFQPPDNLYRLPEMSAGYDQLNETIRAVRSSLEAEYGVSADVATIVSGEMCIRDRSRDWSAMASISSTGTSRARTRSVRALPRGRTTLGEKRLRSQQAR